LQPWKVKTVLVPPIKSIVGWHNTYANTTGEVKFYGRNYESDRKKNGFKGLKEFKLNIFLVFKFEDGTP
jgi:hypothetical protein